MAFNWSHYLVITAFLITPSPAARTCQASSPTLILIDSSFSSSRPPPAGFCPLSIPLLTVNQLSIHHAR
jgi:hypothetical protein